MARFCFLGFIVLMHCSALSAQVLDVKLMSFNVRVPVDPAPNDWASRAPRVMDIILKESPDILGVQEAVAKQVSDLNNSLPDYGYLGRGREVDGGGEGTQIFYNKNHWKLDASDTGTLQISPTPNVPGSNAWNFQWPRIFTWAHLYSKKTGKGFYVFNTHFPLKPEERDLSVKLLADSIAARKHKNEPVVLLGDFNACSNEASMKYLRGESGSPVAMVDSFLTLHPNDKSASYHGFGKKTDGCRIDYIYVQGKVDVISSDIIKDQDGAGYASDHYAVSARVKLHP